MTKVKQNRTVAYTNEVCALKMLHKCINLYWEHLSDWMQFYVKQKPQNTTISYHWMIIINVMDSFDPLIFWRKKIERNKLLKSLTWNKLMTINFVCWQLIPLCHSLLRFYLVSAVIGRNEGSGSKRDAIHSVLRSVPRGLTLGPSLAKDGQLGLWCVGRVLEKDTLLGLEGPGEIISIEKEEVWSIQMCFRFHSAPYLHASRQ